MKITILGNQARAVYNFWPALIRHLLAAGHETFCVVPFPSDALDRDAAYELERLGARPRFYRLDRKGLNPLYDAATFKSLFSLFKKERPDILFASTIKPVIWGLLAARLAGVPNRYGMITGLGFAFEADTLPKKALNLAACGLYKAALSGARGIFFQNADDRDVFLKSRIISANAPVTLFPQGTGVDIERFSPAPPPQGAPVFLLVARLLEAKGVREYCRAAEMLKAGHPDAQFRILGPEEKGAGSVALDELRSYMERGIVTYLGKTNDVRPFVAEASVMVLPSYREGLPCSLMEGMAMGRCAVAANVPGCRDLVRPEVNGLLVPVRNVPDLAKAMERFLLEPDLAATLGANARKLIEEEYDARNVAANIAAAMGV